MGTGLDVMGHVFGTQVRSSFFSEAVNWGGGGGGQAVNEIFCD